MNLKKHEKTFNKITLAMMVIAIILTIGSFLLGVLTNETPLYYGYIIGLVLLVLSLLTYISLNLAYGKNLIKQLTKNYWSAIPITVMTLMLITILAIAAVPGFGSSLIGWFNAGPQYCANAPYDHYCICPTNKLKVNRRMGYQCKDKPELPDVVEMPIETYPEAIKYLENQISDTFECSGDAFWEINSLTGPLPQPTEGYYGEGILYEKDPDSDKMYIGGYMVIMECLTVEGTDDQGRPLGGDIVASFRFDPNDGWIYHRTCNPDYVNNCPEPIRHNWKQVNPGTYPPICGDNHCTVMENHETCPQDCLDPEYTPICGDGECWNDHPYSEDTESRYNCPQDCCPTKIPDMLCTRSDVACYYENFDGTIQELENNMKYACEHPTFNFDTYLRSQSQTDDHTRVSFGCLRYRGGGYSTIMGNSVDMTQPPRKRTVTGGGATYIISGGKCFNLP